MSDSTAAHVALTVHLPDGEAVPANPVVCFAKPGGGYSKGYYTLDLPGPAHGAQAEWHAQRGWIFVSVDHLGVGASSTHHGLDALTPTVVAAASEAAEQEVLGRLAAGSLAEGFPAVTEPLRLGIGQSMGGCMTVIQQGRYHCYDGIGVLGYSVVHTHPPTRPGTVPITAAWMPRDALPTAQVAVNAPALAAATLSTQQADTEPAMAGASSTTTSTPRWSEPTWSTSPHATAESRPGRRPPCRPWWRCGAWPPAQWPPRRRRSPSRCWWPWASGTSSPTRGASRAPTSWPHRSTCSSVAGWAICITSPAPGSFLAAYRDVDRVGAGRQGSSPHMTVAITDDVARALHRHLGVTAQESQLSRWVSVPRGGTGPSATCERSRT